MTSDRHNDVRLLLQAESYDFEEIGLFKAFHPEAPRPSEITQNMLLIGPAGTGKSMAMRQACFQLRDSPHFFPVYVHAERWVARSFSEAIVPSNRPRDNASVSRARVCATATLAYGTLARLLRVAGDTVAYRAARVFSDRPDNASALSDWLDASFHRCEYVVRTGQALPTELRRLPQLREIFEIYGEAVGVELQRRLLLLFDQLDRVSPLYLDLLALALGRSTAYVLAVATRPSPCAPEPTELALRAGDCTRRWLGADWMSPQWRLFLGDAARTVLPPEVSVELIRRIDYLAPLIGPSTRYFLGIGNEFARIYDGASPLGSLHRSIDWMRGSVESELGPSLIHYPAPARFLRSLQNHLSLAAEAADGVWPKQIAIKPLDRLFLGAVASERLRVAVREGLLVPAETNHYGLDEVTTDYDVVPLAALKSTPVEPLRVGGQAVIDERDFLEWGEAPGRGRRRVATGERAKIFYSHWMNAQNGHAQTFLPDFRELVALQADVLVGESEVSQPLPDFIRSLIREATMTIVQLHPFRPTIGLEIGWSMGSSKPLLLAMSDPSELSEFPSWITSSFEVQSNGAADRAKFAKSALRILEAVAAGDTSVQWKIEEDGTPLMALRRELTSLVVIGSGPAFHECLSFLTERCASEGIAHPRFLDTGDLERGALLFEVVRCAYTATTLLCAFDGKRIPDLLTAIALGAHTHVDKDEGVVVAGQRRIIARPALVVAAKDAQAYTVPGLVRGLRDALVTEDAGRASEEAWLRFLAVQRRIQPGSG
jgi:hypothetical protein